VLGCLFLAPSAFAQEELDLFELSLEELMNVEIVSASRKSENLFDAPVSSYTITRSEIAKAGITSIPEAMRLCPGVVVREITNGNYDVHLRGFDNLVRYSESFAQNNLLTLVMIDDRPVFNHNLGGTVWESLPIDLIDVERIEIVRGPAAALFGPNAVTGVINIITRQTDKPGLHTSANLQYGVPTMLGANVSVGYKFDKSLDVIVSTNYQQRERGDEGYYVYDQGMYFDDLLEIGVPYAESTHANAEQSLEKHGINGFFRYKPSPQVSLSFTTGLQAAEAQRSYYNFNVVPLNTSTIDRRYAYLNGAVHGVGVRASYASGNDNLYQGFGLIQTLYDASTTDVALDYEWKISEKLQLRPEVSYQQAVIDDRAYTDVSNGSVGFFNGRVANNTLAGSVKADYQPTKALRVVGAVRIDKFKVPNRAYASYQAAVTYKPQDRYLFRVVHSRATSGAFLGSYFLSVPPSIVSPTRALSYQGNSTMDVASNTMTELGLRIQATEALQFDIALFDQKLKDLNYPFNTSVVPLTEELILLNFQFQNLHTEAVQRGLTLSANIVPNQRLHFKPFVTIQKTNVDNLPVGISADFANQVSDEHQATPTFYGGAYVNFQAHQRLNTNLSMYYFDQHTMYHYSDLGRLATTGEAINPVAGPIAGKLLANAKVSYRVAKKLDIYLNARNLLGNDRREYYGTDRIGRSLLGGVSYNF
jgi:iron complex outermembrane receptor protein